MTAETKVPVRQRANKRKSPIKRALSLFVWGAFVLFALLVGTVAGWLGRSKVTSEIIRNLTADPRQVFASDSVTLLLLGCDEDLAPGGQKVLKAAGRADMILLVKLDFKDKTIRGVSVPRDTKCQLPGGEVHKLNAYHNIAKPSAADALQQKAVEHVTGVKIDRTIVIDYNAFQEMVDAVGGVPVNIKGRMLYSDKAGGLYVDFKPGRKVLDGYDSMCYVRYRKGKGDELENGDFRRTERQREFLLSFKSQIVKNIVSLPEVVEKGSDVMQDALSPKEIGSLASFFTKIKQSDIAMGRLPTRPNGNMEVVAISEAKKMLEENGFETSLRANTRTSRRRS